MFENHRRGRQARNFTTNVPKILDLKSSSEQIFFRKLSLGAPEEDRRASAGRVLNDSDLPLISNLAQIQTKLVEFHLNPVQEPVLQFSVSVSYS